MTGHFLRIDKYGDSLCLRNPGKLKLSIEQIYEGGTSRARNPRMQNMLRMIGYGENLGSGFPLILTAWKDAGWGEPVLKNKVEIDEVELELPIKTKNAPVKFSKTQMMILPIIQANKYVTYEELANTIGVDRTTIMRNIGTMKKKGVIKRVGGDKSGHWEVLLDISHLNS